MAVALDPQGSGTAVTWDNPASSHKGSFTPNGAPFVENNEICRAFKADMTVKEETQNFMGKACRPSGEDWNILAFDAVPDDAGKTSKQAAASPVPLAQ